MKNYKECSMSEFTAAMNNKYMPVETIPDVHLYILYTKFEADAAYCFLAGSSYATFIGRCSESSAKVYKDELLRRRLLLAQNEKR